MADERDERGGGGGSVCANPPCTCPTEQGDKYCSVHCQSAPNTVQIDCDCGHESCGGDF